MAGSANSLPKIGLVLTGGGAKGAYQIGCLKALRKAGYANFSAISGTSVGAMTAILLAAGNLEAAEEAWINLRCRDIIGFKPYKILLLPLWAIAAIFSEFCIAKVLRIPGSLLMPLHRVLLGKITPADAEDLPAYAWVIFALLGVLMFLDDWSRRVFLGWIFTTNEPLASRLGTLLSDEDINAVGRANVPIYATLSRYHPGVGWFPQYVRLDKLNREKVVDTLVQSAGFPGIFPGAGYFGRHVVDGGWTDNIPVAPLLFDPAARVDLIFVLKVDKSARRPSKWKRVIAATGAKLWGSVASRPAGDQDTLLEWAWARWQAFLQHDPAQAAALRVAAEASAHLAGANDPSNAAHSHYPRIVTVVPPGSLGSIVTGTFWFSRAKARRIIDRGEQDMTAILAEMDQPLPLAGPDASPVAARAEAPFESRTAASA